VRLIGAISVLALVTVPVALSAADSSTGSSLDGAASADSLSSPLSEKQAALRQAGLTAKLNGTIPAGTKVAKVAKGQYVELAREGEDSILTVLGEFGTATNSAHHGHTGGLPGPLHNQIPQPDRAVDNTTIWAPDFSQSYYNTCCSTTRRAPTRCATSTRSSRRTATRSTAP
jgi:immune inhibitor A